MKIMRLFVWLFKVSECYITVSTYALENAECWGFENSDLFWCKHQAQPQEKFLVNEEDNQMFSQSCQQNPPWHLDRITQQSNLDFSKPYPYTEYVLQPTVYVLDTYVQTNHPDFEGRVQFGHSVISGSSNPHGTHVTGLIASKTYGVCKHCRVITVTVLNDNGSGYFSDLIKGLSWVSYHSSKTKVSVINISISGKGSAALDLALESLHKQGLVVVVAAGNDGRSASEYSPARSVHAISVGATNFNDEMAAFSNFGNSVDILAPGEYIHSTIPQSTDGWMSGTSMASPIVAGTMALIVSKYPFVKDVWKLKRVLQDEGLKGVIKGVRLYTPNLLANTRDTNKCEKQNKFFNQ